MCVTNIDVLLIATYCILKCKYAHSSLLYCTLMSSCVGSKARELYDSGYLICVSQINNNGTLIIIDVELI